MEEEKRWRTHDVLLAAVLSIFLQQEPKLVEFRGRIIFTFAATPRLYMILDEYNAGASLSAFDLVSEIRRLRSLMFQKKNEFASQGDTR